MKKELIKYVQENKRVCPMPNQWNELWQKLPDKIRVGAGWKPSLPLILAAWWDTANAQKRDKLIQHINYAEEKGVLAKIDKYLRSLKEDCWLHEGDIKSEQ